MLKFEFKLESAGADAADNPQELVAMALRKVADDLETFNPSFMTGTIRDINGNTIGSWKIDAAFGEGEDNDDGN